MFTEILFTNLEYNPGEDLCYIQLSLPLRTRYNIQYTLFCGECSEEIPVNFKHSIRQCISRVQVYNTGVTPETVRIRFV